MIFWLIAGAMVAVSVAFLLWPLTRPEAEKAARADFDLTVYKDQLKELERDRARGILSDAELESARTEVERRILDLAGASPTDALRKSGGSSATRLLAGLVALALPALALVIYGNLGAPQLPGLPLAERGGAPVVDLSAISKILRDLERRLEQNPADVDAWIELGHRRREGATPQEAAAAYRQALDLAPERQEARMGLAESVILINQGNIVPEARQLIAEVLEADPNAPAALYYAGLALVQDGALPQASEIWRDLLAATPADAPWREMLQSQLARLDAEMGVAGNDGGGAPFAMPDAETQAAVQSMAPEDQAAFIRDNVTRLAERLEEEPDDLQGWLMLSRSYGVLGEPQKARDALLKAGALAQGLPEGAPLRLQIESALKAAGIEP